MERLVDQLADLALNSPSIVPETAMAEAVDRMQSKLTDSSRRGFETSVYLNFRYPKHRGADSPTPAETPVGDLKKSFPILIKSLESDDEERTALFQLFINTMLTDGFSGNDGRLKFVGWLRTRISTYPAQS